MRKVELLVLAMIAASAFGVATAAPTSAATLQWLSNGAAILTATAAVESGTVSLEDLKAGVGMQCVGTGTGTVGPGTTDVETTVKAEKCTITKGTCPSPSAEAVKLPWTTGLRATTAVGTGVEDAILSESGYAVTCAGIIKDSCTSRGGVILVTQLSAVVQEEFPAADNEDIGTCSLGGSEADISGSFSVEGTGGDSISIES